MLSLSDDRMALGNILTPYLETINNERTLYMPQTANTSLTFLDTLDYTHFCLKMCIHATDVMDEDKGGGGNKNISAIITM